MPFVEAGNTVHCSRQQGVARQSDIKSLKNSCDRGVEALYRGEVPRITRVCLSFFFLHSIETGGSNCKHINCLRLFGIHLCRLETVRQHHLTVVRELDLSICSVDLCHITSFSFCPIP